MVSTFSGSKAVDETGADRVGAQATSRMATPSTPQSLFKTEDMGEIEVTGSAGRPALPAL
jgi:hypothetical protein